MRTAQERLQLDAESKAEENYRCCMEDLYGRMARCGVTRRQAERLMSVVQEIAYDYTFGEQLRTAERIVSALEGDL